MVGSELWPTQAPSLPEQPSGCQGPCGVGPYQGLGHLLSPPGKHSQRGNLLHGVAQLGIELASKDGVIHACMPVVLGVASPDHLHLHHGRGTQVPHQALVDRGDRSQRLHRQSDSFIKLHRRAAWMEGPMCDFHAPR